MIAVIIIGKGKEAQLAAENANQLGYSTFIMEKDDTRIDAADCPVYYIDPVEATFPEKK